MKTNDEEERRCGSPMGLASGVLFQVAYHTCLEQRGRGDAFSSGAIRMMRLH